MTRSRTRLTSKSRPRAPLQLEKTVTIANRVLPVSPVLNTLFLFMAERHAIHQRRLAGEPYPWTEDPILLKYPFTNVFRIFDRMTQYILQNVVNKGDNTLEESVFRVTLFRLFARTSTWELLQDHLGELTWRNFDIDVYTDILRDATERGISLYGCAYLMPAPKLGGDRNYLNHLRLLQILMQVDLPGQLKKCAYLKDAYGRISLFPSLGNFLGYQLLLDINMIPQLSFPENWATCGPGAQDCLKKIFGPGVQGIEGRALEYLHYTQDIHFARLGVPISRRPRIAPDALPGVSVVDLEHSLCECEKYSRAMHPEIKGKRTNVSRHRSSGGWEPSREPLTAELPRRWLSSAMRAKPIKPLPPVDPTEPEPSYHVSHIVSEAPEARGTLYQVRWLGYGPEEDMWLDEKELCDAPEVLKEWSDFKAVIAAKVSAFQAAETRGRPRVSL